MSSVTTMDSKTIKKRNSNWNSEVRYALGFYRLLGENLGFWPFESHGFGSNIRILFVTIIELWMSISLTKRLITFGNCGVITDIVDALSLIVCGYLTAMKVIIPRIYQQSMLIIMDSAVDDWSTVINKKSRDIMMKYAFMGRLVFIVQMSGAYTVGFPLIFLKIPFVTSLLNDQSNSTIFTREVPIGPNCWISDNSSVYLYVSEFILQSIQLFITCTAYIGCDTYFFGIGMHLCGQFEVLYTQVDNLFGNGNNFLQKQRLNDFVKRHNHLLKLANNFETTYNMIILAQIAGDTLLICISAIVLLMSLNSANVVIIAGLIIRIYLVYVQLFMYSYVGEILTTKAENLRIAVYNCPWYNMPPNIVRDMKFVIMRNNYRFNLTAGKMYSMNIENFKNIVKTMGSYFSVLRLMFIENE